MKVILFLTILGMLCAIAWWLQQNGYLEKMFKKRKKK